LVAVQPLVSDRSDGAEPATCWDAAQSAPDFLATPETDLAFYEPKLLAPGSITELYSPRGLGKTHIGHALAIKLAKGGRRVLLLDRDNSPREVRRRLKGWD